MQILLALAAVARVILLWSPGLAVIVALIQRNVKADICVCGRGMGGAHCRRCMGDGLVAFDSM